MHVAWRVVSLPGNEDEAAPADLSHCCTMLPLVVTLGKGGGKREVFLRPDKNQRLERRRPGPLDRQLVEVLKEMPNVEDNHCRFRAIADTEQFHSCFVEVHSNDGLVETSRPQ